MPGIIGPDDLSGWVAAPPAARARGAPELIRTFDTAEAALAFLARHVAESCPKRLRCVRRGGWQRSHPLNPGLQELTRG
jgi:hypothetical protein